MFRLRYGSGRRRGIRGDTMSFFKTKTFDLWWTATVVISLNTTLMYVLSKDFGLFDFYIWKSFLMSCVWFLLFYKKDLFAVIDEWIEIRKEKRK